LKKQLTFIIKFVNIIRVFQDDGATMMITTRI